MLSVERGPVTCAPGKANMRIADDQRLVRVVNSYGRELPIYDDGFGPLWVHRDSMGISGVVRAQTWEDAYGICEDEFFPAGDKEAAEERAKIEALPEDSAERKHLEDCFDEAYGYRSSGRREGDGSQSYIYAKDLNGDSLEPLTEKLCAGLGLKIELASE